MTILIQCQTIEANEWTSDWKKIHFRSSCRNSIYHILPGFIVHRNWGKGLSSSRDVWANLDILRYILLQFALIESQYYQIVSCGDEIPLHQGLSTKPFLVGHQIPVWDFKSKRWEEFRSKSAQKRKEHITYRLL